MTANEYRETLDRLGITQAGAAKLLHVDERTSRKWALGERKVAPMAVVILRLYEVSSQARRLLKEWSW